MKIQLNSEPSFKQKALIWANKFDICAIYDSNAYKDQYSSFDYILAVDYTNILESSYQEAFDKLSLFRKKNNSWIFGGLAYDLKNEIEDLSSAHPDLIQFPDLFFFTPKHLITIKDGELDVLTEDLSIVDTILNIDIESELASPEEIILKSGFSKEEYITTVNKIKGEISSGNIYETNFCIEFSNKDININPQDIYQKLNKNSPTPFASYFKWFDKYIIGASPERFIAKRGSKLISQPIKGTSKRGKTKEEDELLKQTLVNHPKEKQENVMIVDLVRNDLTKSAKPSSVYVEELFGIYTFKQVHQMISTVVCEANPDLSVIDILKNTFPMGSMTGAPKIKAMQLMELYEKSRRGIYSGAIGYISPNDDFDFNVVIRSILYNNTLKTISFHAGSAITYYANPELEYEECLLKISAMLSSLNGKIA